MIVCSWPNLNAWKVKHAARIIRSGGIVAYPTEAVYGLGCDPWNVEAVLRLLDLKQRPIGKGLILIGASWAHLRPFLTPLTPDIRNRVERTWPGPVTWLLPASDETPVWLRGQHASIAVRITAHPIAAALCQAVDTALVSTSANLSGRPPTRSALRVRRALGHELDYLLVGPLGSQQRPTEIRDARTGTVLRAA